MAKRLYLPSSVNAVMALQGKRPQRVDDPDELRMKILLEVDKAIDDYLPFLQPGQGLGILFKLEIINEDRNSPEYRSWREAVIKRAGRQCEKCGSRVDLCAHHIESWADHPESRYDITNGQALCRTCHAKEHPDLAELILAG